jgi:hypothetical protein
VPNKKATEINDRVFISFFFTEIFGKLENKKGIFLRKEPIQFMAWFNCIEQKVV